jgi:arabinofuranan 3-O-arabinosyltransferase
VVSWRDGDRAVRVGAGPSSLVWMHENTNPGWKATLDGRRLEPLVVDGWQQGFALPAGDGGNLRITFGPQSSYAAALVTGLVTALLLLVLTVAAFPFRRSGLLGPERPRRRLPTPWGGVAIAAAVPAAWLLAGPAVAIGLAVGAFEPRVKRLGRRARSFTGAAAVALAVLAAAVSSQLGGSTQPSWASLVAGLGVGVLLAAATDPGPARRQPEVSP